MKIQNTNTVNNEVNLANAILSSNRFKVEDAVHAGRAAKALDRYVFLQTSFEGIASKLYENSVTNLGDKSQVFSNVSGLEEVLNGLTLVENANATDVEKVKVLLELYKDVFNTLSNLTTKELSELQTVNTLLNSRNPLKETWSFCQILATIVVVILACIGFVMGDAHA